MPFVLILVLAWPFLEIAGFVIVGQRIGVLATIGLTFLSSAAGIVLLRVQGIALLQRMRAELTAGRMPGVELGHGALIAFAGLCLLVPGFLSDLIGLLLFIPPVRDLVLGLLSRNMQVVVRTERRSGVVDLDPQDWHEVRPSSSQDPNSGPPRSLTGPDRTP